MYKSIRFLQKGVFFVSFLIATSGPWRAVIATDYSAFDFSSTPPILSQNVTPMVLFGMSNDHQLFYKAYTDYDDLDADGTTDTTYLHSFSYYGYFDSEKCYLYNSTDEQFEPKSLADSDNYCTGTSRNYWSGNYLNWASMARIDTVRKLLYGGARSTDTATETVLERTYLPNDAHSFAKYYNGDDLDNLTPFSGTDIQNGITICNTTVSNTPYSQDVTDAPLIRVAKGNYALWAANERWQCRWHEEEEASNANQAAYSGIDAASSNPEKNSVGLGQKDYNARIQVCVTDKIGSENCKQYPDGNYKPIGLVQKYGDDEIVNFGLMTGSYTKNKSGGVLRKNVGGTSDEINATTDGTFKDAPADGSIITTLDSFRLYGYAHNVGNHDDDGTYNTNGDGDNCKWAKSSFVNGDCSNWGNPVAEILSECYRYYGGKNAEFATNDSGKIEGLTTADWSDPLNTVNECAKLNVIMINASSISYDSDELGAFDTAFSDDGSALVENTTKAIGDDEGITGSKFFVGENGTDNNQLCSAKTVTNLGDVQGVCPDAPRLEGSYKMAGAAHYAYTNDLRESLDGEQTVTTYGVALSPAIPSITIPVPGGSDEVNILPACRNTKRTPNTNCAIVDFKITAPYQEDGNTGEYTGALYVNWEDSEQGGDYDQDMWGTIQYRITSSKITITTDVIAESTGEKLGFGYVISGTTDDGFHVHSGIEEVSLDGCSSCKAGDAATSQEYTLGSSTADFLKSPLYYAAKWGGFTDLDGDEKPSSTSEWDTTDNTTGDSVPDGIPDKYFLATNPSQLESQLKQVLDSIIASTSSGTSAAVVSNSTSGVGAIYQALYQPQMTQSNTTIEWIGRLNGIFIDDKAHLREDSNADGILDDYDTDKIIKISYDAALGDTFFQRYSTSDDGTTLTTYGGLESLDDLLPIWSAVDQLAILSNEDIRTQRSYGTEATGVSADKGRYIFTALKDTGSSTSMLNNNDVQAFTASNMGQYYGYMAIDEDDVIDVVNYIRGDDSVSNSRNRTLDSTVWRLGDIIHSSPVLVSSPDGGYDDSHGDTDYGEFVTKYSDRRQMVYIGANDGMLHAFNAGFWEESTSQFKVTNTDSSVVEHPLGAEVWAYVPTNLLPHLQWLKDANYPHVYYMDGVGFAQDVKIFDDTGDDEDPHVNGWGTILVMGMRFGGGAMDLDSGGINQTTGSGYVIMDITDPESPPVLLAEITAPEFGYTTSKPVIVQDRSGNNNKWTLVIGSGPHGDSALTMGHSDQDAKIIQVNLNRVFNNYNKNQSKSIYRADFSPSDSSTSEGTSLVGDLIVADWDEDLEDDVVYFGTSSLSGTNVEGKLMRLKLSNGDVNTLVQVQKPIMSAPLTGIDTTIDTNRWVMAGTGRFFTSADTLNEDQQWFFGVKEVKELNNTYDYDTAVSFGNLEDTTDIKVYSDGSLLDGDGNTYSLGGDDIDNFEEMKNGTVDKPTAGMIGHYGWKVSFEQASGSPSGRSTGSAIADPINTGLIVFAEYVPPSEVCEVNGDSYIWALSFETGTSTYYAPLGQDVNYTTTNETGGTEIASSNKISSSGTSDTSDGGGGTTGLVSGITYHNGSDGVKLIISDSTGGITTVDVGSVVVTGSEGRQSWRQIDTSAF